MQQTVEVLDATPEQAIDLAWHALHVERVNYRTHRVKSHQEDLTKLMDFLDEECLDYKVLPQ